MLAGAGLALGLVACAAASAVQVVCLPMPQYSAKDQAEILAGYLALPAGSILHRVIGDYLAMRDADRACLASMSVTGTGTAP